MLWVVNLAEARRWANLTVSESSDGPLRTPSSHFFLNTLISSESAQFLCTRYSIPPQKPAIVLRIRSRLRMAMDVGDHSDGSHAYHVCHDGREGHQGASFLCTNGTLFDQAKFACDWWYNVDCSQAVSLYKLNADPLKNPYVPKPKPEELQEEGIYYKQL
ncbi:hypothetical protein EVAR_50274_1 [Eumeta japonica]|uniref:Chitin-binding type-2 domain-containing protein n=1 Tax=Eumeta variegata TaxID=151549 RepID=A0A4C1Y655_EUMVA|nr:hypothetical protein EVAR_50274_1 [Eumeta japonica]